MKEFIEITDFTDPQLDVYAREKEVTHFCATCVQLARLADALLDSQQITWWNLLTGGCPGRTGPVCPDRNGSR